MASRLLTQAIAAELAKAPNLDIVRSYVDKKFYAAVESKNFNDVTHYAKLRELVAKEETKADDGEKATAEAAKPSAPATAKK